MSDPFSWSLPLGRLFGITIKVHFLFPFVAFVLILRVVYKDGAAPGVWLDACSLMAILFFSVLLHECGHCAGARLVDGDAEEVLLWPLGGLAAIDVPHNWRANLIAVVFGPLTNLILCLAIGLIFVTATKFQWRLPLNPLWPSIVIDKPGAVILSTWHGDPVLIDHWGHVLLARAFWINWALFLLNVLLLGFPMDGGRIVQCVLWPLYDFRQATLFAIYAGFGTMLVVALLSLVFNEAIGLFLACFIYVTCRQQYIILETGGEESLFGYDFTQGYTSLEREQTPRRRRSNFFKRWLQERRRKRLEREQEQREADEKRMDELLEKIQRFGKESLTAEETRFLERVSHRYRNRQ